MKIYLLVGDKDLLFPYQKSIENVNHGIETYDKALNNIKGKIRIDALDVFL